mmetsp:Transcript_14513/g.27877  ORF Transcript_14513/g.27877 Transcript_14513/m.27877 type:complete len:375 (-) Transcript_14513:266-1390(-)|eukprot:CAMPEP_0114284400 /NCGR_PEP_ID=MMETSP0059-20121206/4627_1 /TAXON_ID=36894 /ORGANISM="Pyramimonas parkeae, Strain CCMP726" /LENGTH=374 /DNA_ID=CAMNT_0001405217 /DNA_START=173 /DNA_END=1297 /DNA_ORIENTATION=+
MGTVWSDHNDLERSVPDSTAEQALEGADWSAFLQTNIISGEESISEPVYEERSRTDGSLQVQEYDETTQAFDAASRTPPLPTPLPITERKDPSPDLVGMLADQEQAVTAIGTGAYQTECLRPMLARPAALMRVVVFPYACGSFSSLVHLFQDMPESVEVWLCEYPGHGGRRDTPPATSVQQIVDELVRSILPLLSKPMVFFGHSMGSHIMYCVAQTLWESSLPIPVHLIASGRLPPHLTHPDRSEMADRDGVNRKMTERMEQWGMTSDRLGYDMYHEQLNLLVECCMILGTPAKATSLPVSITVYWGELEDVDMDMVFIYHWAELSTTGSFRLHEFQGGHYYFNESKALQAKVRERLEEDICQHLPATMCIPCT